MKLRVKPQEGFGRTYPERVFGRDARTMARVLKELIRVYRKQGMMEAVIQSKLILLLGGDYTQYITIVK